MIEHKLIKDLARRLVRHQIREDLADPLRVEINLMNLLIGLDGPADRHIAGYRALADEVSLSMEVDYVVGMDFDDAKQGVQDIVLVPLFGFNHLGYRLGRGGGFYDKLLTNPNLLSIGIGTSAREVTFISEAHDIPMDYIVTELGVRKVTNK